MTLEVFELDEFQRGNVSGCEDHARGRASFERLLPARDAQAPLVAGLLTGEPILGHGRGEIIARGLREAENLGRHLHANGVQTVIAGAGVAAAVAVKSGGRVEAARLDWCAEDIGRL